MNYQSPSLNQMVYDLKNTYSAGRTTKDFPQVSDNQIKSWIITKRSVYLNQQLSKGKSIDADFVQNLGCVSVNMVDRSTCCSEDIGCTFLRTSDDIPTFIQISRIGPVDTMAKKWDMVDYTRIPLEKYAPKYSRKFIKGFFTDFDRGLYIYYNPEYFPEGKYLTQINILAVLEDPTQASKFNNCITGSSCYDDNGNFPITLKLWDAIKKDILQNELRLSVLTEEDDSNDSKSNPNQNQLKNARN